MQNAVAETDGEYDDLGNVARIRQLIADLLDSPQLREADRRRDALARWRGYVRG